jgi:tRNA(Ile)-lysidine synthase TilS/MesJ
MANGGTIITAHHLNDWVESYLMNCLRGNPERRPFEVLTDFGNFRVIHPFLLTKKVDFHQYIERNMMMKFFVEDETNFITKGSRRNWVRNDLIPSLKSQDISLEKYAKRCVGSLYDEYIDNERNEN